MSVYQRVSLSQQGIFQASRSRFLRTIMNPAALAIAQYSPASLPYSIDEDRLAGIDEVGQVAAFLVAEAFLIDGEIEDLDQIRGLGGVILQSDGQTAVVGLTSQPAVVGSWSAQVRLKPVSLV